MRKKERTPIGVADGISFDEGISEQIPEQKDFRSTPDIPRQVNSHGSDSPPHIPKTYYISHPRKGSKGGDLGRRKITPEKKKVQFSLTCTPEQKRRYMEAAELDRRKLPDFINNAIEEYISNHNLL